MSYLLICLIHLEKMVLYSFKFMDRKRHLKIREISVSNAPIIHKNIGLAQK